MVMVSEAWGSQGFSFSQLPDPSMLPPPGFTFGTRESADGSDRLYPVPSLFLRGPEWPYRAVVMKSVKDCTLQGGEEESWPGQTAVPISL